MHRSKKKRNIIIFSLVGVLLCMVVGYAAFQTQLKVSGTSKVTSNWDIEITNVTSGTPTGSAENTVAPSWDKLWASMEADLYDKGDAMEYDVTIENKGTLDAKLNDIITNLDNSNNEAVIITFSGYTKGEVLKAKNSKIIHVKIEYNPEYEGGETSSEVEINFDYGQNNNEENNPDNQYLLTYDYSTNGGTSVELTEELIASGNNVDLSNTATKEGWNFVGWNTDKDAQIGLENYQMPASNTTLYAIYSKTLKVTYEKGDSVESIGKNEDSCNIYNNGTSCEITLPEITVTDDSATVGWYEGNNKVGEPNDKYTITNDITLRAEAQFEPIIQSWASNASTDFHAEEYRTNIITATFLDNKDVPEGATSWDVSSEKNGSVMAWVIPDEIDPTKYHLYIGGDGGVIANKDSGYLFQNFTNLQTITFGNNFDTSNVTTMQSMFSNCSSLTTLDVSNFDTSNVTNMYMIFTNCNSLTELDVSKWDTGNVTNMNSMFSGCSSLTTLDVSDWNTSKVTNMNGMFYNCSSLTTLDVSNFDTSNVTIMYGMFQGCSSLTTLDVSDWNTSKVTSMTRMFESCSSLTTLNVSNWETNNVTDMSFMFYRCSNLPTLDVSNWNTSNVTSMRAMFSNCSSLTILDVSKWNTSNVTSMRAMFSSCSKLTTLDVSNWDTGNVTSMESMFSRCRSLTTIDVSNFDTSKVTNMHSMFNGCSSLTTLDVSEWDTGNVTDMGALFMGCSSLIRLDINNWNTSKVTTMGSKSSYNTSDGGMFQGCSSLTTIDLSNWDTSNVLYMGQLFQDCTNLSNINLSGIETSSVTNMSFMFSHCDSLKKIILCSFDTGNVLYMVSMFRNNAQLKAVYVGPNWTTENANTSSMFQFSGVSSVTQSDNCEIDSEEMSLEISTTSTTNSITVVANTTADSGIAKYEYSKDGGNSWTSSSYNTYTFNGLTKNTSYNIRVTSNNGKQTTQSTTVYTKNITTPTFRETETSSGKNVTITYPSGCGNNLTCTYQKDNGSIQYVYSTTAVVEFIESGSVVAKVSDGTNSVSSSYTVEISKTVTMGGQEVDVVSSGDGLYKDVYEDGKYTYKGANPNNYITFNNETWRIISMDSDQTIKIVRNQTLGNRSWNNSSGNIWNNSALYTYLSTTYFNSITTNYNRVATRVLYYPGAVINNNSDLQTQINNEKATYVYTAIGMPTLSEFIRANNNSNQCGTYSLNNSNYSACKSTNWMVKSFSNSTGIWTITPSISGIINYVQANNRILTDSATVAYDILPVIVLIPDTQLSGAGTQSNPYRIIN